MAITSHVFVQAAHPHWLGGYLAFDPRDADEIENTICLLDPRHVTHGWWGRLNVQFATDSAMVMFVLGPFERVSVEFERAEQMARITIEPDKVGAITDWIEEMMPNTAAATALALIEIEQAALKPLRQALRVASCRLHQKPDLIIRPFSPRPPMPRAVSTVAVVGA